MTTYALDILTGAAKLLGVVFKGEALSADEAADGLVTLNDMLDSWSNDNLNTFVYANETFPLTGATSYTMGVGGNFNTSRPINISAAVITIAGVDYDLIPITQEQYLKEVSNKSIISPIPQYLVYDNGYPLATINLFPNATAGSSIKILSNKPLANLSLLTSIVDMPPGWKRALKYNLAIELAPQYGVQIPQSVPPIAATSLGAIKRSVAINNAMPLMPSGVAAFSIYGGTPGN